MSSSNLLPDIGDTIGGRFRIQEHIGEGGFGTVYRALQESIGREVALKFLTPGVAKDPTNVQRFRREAFHVSQLRHPNTITLFDYGQTDNGLIYMVMEFIDGISLVEEIEDKGGLELERGAHIYEQILESLSEAHREGLVHRDLKPENIFLCEMFGQEDYVKVLDFGVAKMTMPDPDSEVGDETLTQAGHIFGTPMYMAPEQAENNPITPATDVYALGLLIYETLTAKPPVIGKNRMDVINKQIQEDVPKLTPELKNSPLGPLIRKACAKDPEERYEDASELLDAFQTAIRRIESTQPREETEVSPPPVPETEDETVIVKIPEDQETPAEEDDPDDYDPTIVTPPPVPQSKVEAAEPRTSSDNKLVGRETLLEDIESHLKSHLGESSNTFVLLEGQSGAGKSSIVEALDARFDTQSIRSGMGNFRRNSLPMEALRESLIDAWHLTDSTRETIHDDIYRELEEYTDFSEDELEFLADFLSRKRAGSLQISDSSEQAGALFALFERLLTHLAEDQPLVLILEDIHFADSTTFRFLEYFAVTLRTSDLPLAFIFTKKTHTTPTETEIQQQLRSINANSGGGLNRFPVKPLEGEALTQLIDAILPMNEPLRERIAWLSQGIPLYAIQIVKYLRNEDQLVKQGDRWKLKSGTPREIELPPDLMEMMGLRINQIKSEHGEELDLEPILEWLAVLGMQTPVDLLEQVLRKETDISAKDIQRGLEVLTNEGVLQQTTAKDLVSIEFQNSLLRESLLENLGDRWSNRYFHQTAAEQKQSFYADRSVELPIVEIADHWRQAGETKRYKKALYEAAKNALNNYDLRRAKDQYAELGEVLTKQGQKGEKWLETQVALAEIARRFGKLGQSEQYYRRAIEHNELSEETEQLAETHRGLAHLLDLQSRHADAAEQYREALRNSRANDHLPGQTKALVGLSNIYLVQGKQSKSRKAQKQLKKLVPRIDDAEVLGKTWQHLAKVSKREGDLRKQYEYLEDAKKVLEGTNHRQALSDVLVSLGRALLAPALDSPDRMAKAKNLLREALELKRNIGDRFGVAEAYRTLGQMEYRNESYDSAEQLLEKSLELHEALGAPSKIGASLNDLGIVHLLKLELDRAETYFNRAMKRFKDVGDPLAVSHTILNHGLVAINRKDIDRAETLFKKAKRMKEAHESEWAVFDLQNNLAFIHLWRGEFDEAEHLFKRTVKKTDEIGTAEEQAVARSYLGLLYCFTDRLHGAALEMGRARADAEDLGSGRLYNLCIVHAAFYAEMTETKETAEELVEELRPNVPFNDLATDVWLGLIERMREEANKDASYSDEFIANLNETVPYFFDLLETT